MASNRESCSFQHIVQDSRRGLCLLRGMYECKHVGGSVLTCSLWPDEGSCSQHSCLHRGWSVCRLGVFHDDGWLSFGPVLDSTVIGCFVNPILGAVVGVGLSSPAVYLMRLLHRPVRFCIVSPRPVTCPLATCTMVMPLPACWLAFPGYKPSLTYRFSPWDR